MMRSTSCGAWEVAVDFPRLITIVPCIAVTMIVGVLAAPAVAQSTGGTMTFELSSYDAPAGTSVTLDLFLEDAVDVQGYQATIEITRVEGRGEVTVGCPDGVTVDETRPDYIFSGLDTVYLTPDCPDCGVVVPQCEGMRVAVARVTGGVDTGATRSYLGTFTLDVSEDATPGSAYKISIVPFPASVVTGSDYGSIPFSISPSQILTDDDQDSIPTVSEWGLIVLALLLLTGLKIKFGRRVPKIACTRGARAGRGASGSRMLALALVLAGMPSVALGKECYRDADCYDDDKCTFDECVNRYCRYTPVGPYGDIAGADGCVPDGVVDEFDVSAIEDAAQGISGPGCLLHNMDISSGASHEADGEINLFDINAVLSAFVAEAMNPCEPAGMCCADEAESCSIVPEAECIGGVFLPEYDECIETEDLLVASAHRFLPPHCEKCFEKFDDGQIWTVRSICCRLTGWGSTNVHGTFNRSTSPECNNAYDVLVSGSGDSCKSTITAGTTGTFGCRIKCLRGGPIITVQVRAPSGIPLCEGTWPVPPP